MSQRESAKRDPRRIADVLSDLLSQRGYAQVRTSEDCQAAWSKVVGDLSKFTFAGDVKRGVLQVTVSNSVILQELTFRKRELIEEVAQALPSHRIRDVRFRLGRLP